MMDMSMNEKCEACKGKGFITSDDNVILVTETCCNCGGTGLKPINPLNV